MDNAHGKPTRSGTYRKAKRHKFGIETVVGASYSVEGKDYEVHNVFEGSQDSKELAELRHHLGALAPGQKITVYYESKAPEVASIRPPRTGKSLLIEELKPGLFVASWALLLAATYFYGPTLTGNEPARFPLSNDLWLLGLVALGALLGIAATGVIAMLDRKLHIFAMPAYHQTHKTHKSHSIWRRFLGGLGLLTILPGLALTAIIVGLSMI